MSIKALAISFCVLTMLGCSDQSESEQPRYGPDPDYRSISVVVPQHYDAWVETFILESVSGEIGWRAPIGIITCCWKHPSGKNADWQAMPGLVLIKWFSFAEQQSYRALIQLENASEIEEKMKEIAPIERYGKTYDMPRNDLTFGLAPGGTVVVWIMNGAENAIEVGRYKAAPFTNEKSDYSQWVDEYMEKESEYLEENGIKLDGW
ncbi:MULTISPECIES: DUF2931 family protein [unclassified Marinobacter]|jgi:hypothetical protein|uniref:DUF2931 family protein n=1 Tax=unclassified Marinobacter TaxID=83889 RepID=UPI000C977A57|nr:MULTISPECIES: DUF2931 family protein [unclassified Marinobacter]MAB51532.1 hypothetical protein [Marinobacter sp.]|tara:strand:- start:978 stop:1595 length:618 start_codon:yes stop_codon:yes gene_type:complete